MTENTTPREQKNTIYKFNSRAAAFSFANRAHKLHMVILGDDGKFWVAAPRITEKLHKLGYEYAD